jgi:hypothetical protein
MHQKTKRNQSSDKMKQVKSNDKMAYIKFENHQLAQFLAATGLACGVELQFLMIDGGSNDVKVRWFPVVVGRLMMEI